MNILFIIHHISKGGGPALRALEMIRTLDKLGHNIYLLTMLPKGKKLLRETKDLTTFLASKNSVIYLPPFASGSFVRKAQHIIHNHDIDVTQVFDTIVTGPAGIRIKNRYNTPTVVRIGVRGALFYEYLLKSGLKGPFMKKILHKTGIAKVLLSKLEDETVRGLNLLTPNSEYLAKFYRPILDENKIQVIRNGIDLSVIKPVSEKNNFVLSRLQLETVSSIITYIGRIEERKGLHLLFKSLKHIIKDHKNAHALIIGSLKSDVTYSSRLIKLAKKLEIENNIHFIGQITHQFVPYYLSMSNIVVLPSFLGWMEAIEGLPNVVLETMACKIPILASKVCGIPEVIEDNKTGFLCNPGNVNELTKKINYVLDNPNVQKKIGNNARLYIERNHDLTDVVKKYADAYRFVT